MDTFYMRRFFQPLRFQLLFIVLLFGNLSQAITYENSWFTTELNECTGRIDLDFVIYVDHDNSLDDYFWVGSSNRIQIKIGSGNWTSIAQMGQGHPGGANTNNYTFNGDDVYYRRLNTSTFQQFSISTNQTGDSSTDRPYWIYTQFYLPESAIGETIQFRFSPTSEFESASTSLPSPPSLDYPFTPDLSTISAEDNVNCNHVVITWDAPNGLCPNTLIEFSRDDVVIGLTSAVAPSFIDATAVAGQTYDYKARLFDNVNINQSIVVRNYGGFSAVDQGARKKVPDALNNTLASFDDCENEVNLSWNFVNDLDAIEVWRDGAYQALIGGNTASYTDVVPVRGQIYSYTLRASNECGWGEFTVPFEGASPADPDPVADVFATVVPGVGIQIDWLDIDLETGYQIERNLLGGGGATFFEIDPDVTTYLDESIVECQTYEYRVLSINNCKPNGVPSDSLRRARLTPDLSNTFDDGSLLGSKGYYSNRVELNWTVENNANFLSGYNIYRKPLISEDDSILIASVNSGNNIYIDNFADAGMLYEYTIIAQTQCETSTVYSNPSQSVGFRSPFGTVTGNVTYTGGIAVEGVRISAESTSQINGNSLVLDGTQQVSVAHKPTLNFENEMLFEAWIRPGSFSNDFELIEKAGSYRVHYNSGSGNFEFSVEHSDGSMSSLAYSQAGILLNNYSHVGFQMVNDSLHYFLNGQWITGADVSSMAPIQSTLSDIAIGADYEGHLDEARLWNMGKDLDKMEQDYSRILNGTEPNLRMYLRMNEGLADYAYDVSRTNGNFNRNHGAISGVPAWSEIIPTNNQLSIAAYTDAAGNYLMNVPYNGLGEGFVLTPSFLIHQFDPSTRALYIGDGQTVHNNIDFEDISSFTVTGTVFYENTTCPAEGVVLSVDGNQVVIDGQPAATATDGSFEIQVPIGEHFVTVSKPGHGFSVGRFPETDRYDFQDDLAGMAFKDSTLVKVVGRVVGGLREGNKKPGFGFSKNNIGTAEIQFVSQLGNGCSGDTLLTNSETGEYVTYLPPLKYVSSVSIVNDPTIDFGVLDLLDLSGTPQEFTAYDTTYTTEGDVVDIDSVSYNRRLDYIHRISPIIVVKDRDGINDFIGDSLYTYVNPNTNDTIVRNLRTAPFRWPIFTRRDDDYQYRALIKIFERYVNADNTALIDSVPSTDGVLTISNGFADVETAEVELSEFNTPDTLKFLVYAFKCVRPNMLENASIPDYSYTRTIEMNVVTGSGQAISWDPIPAVEVPTGGDQKFRAIYLGSKTDGAQFVTAGPQVPDYVLRDPPGSGSSASRETESVRKQETGWSWNLETKAHMEDAFFLGAKFTLGIGVSTATDNQINTTAGFSASVSGGRKGSQSITTANTQSWTTNSGGGTPGSGSDLYIGRSMNIQFGVSEHLAIVPDSLCDQVECLGLASPSFQYARRYSLSIVPGGYQTTFIYNQDNIINEQIPNLLDLRNAILQSNVKYTSHLPISNPNYGKNNDDEIFGPLATDSDFGSLDGPSYTYLAINEEDSLTGDSVRFVNNQIKQWEDAIRLNEWEKVNIGNQQVRDSLKQQELDDLKAANLGMLVAYGVLAVANGAGGLGVAYGLIATPVPGSSFAGYAVFAVTTATGIAQAEIAEEFARYQQEKDRIEEKYSQTEPANYSISGGNTFTSSMTHASATSRTSTVEYGMTASMKFELANKVSNNGVGFKKGIELNYKSGRNWTDETSESEQVSFTLADNDQSDFFSVDVYPSLLGWGPVFKKQAGGQTSCPYEDEELSMFYEPGSVLSNATLQVDKPVITASPSILYNVPVSSAAAFNLTLGNESESGDDREYQVSMVSSSNPFGAIATIDGNSSILVNVPAGSSINKVLSIEKGPGAVYDYDSLLFVITAPCEGMNLADSVYVSARFIPACTEVELVVPEESWVANTFNDDTIPAAIAGYDINFFDFEELKIEYKPSNESNWIGLQTFYRDTTGLNDPDAIPIPTSQSFTLYDWDISQLTDGYFDLRTRSICTLANQSSITYSGIVDRINPHPFGTPSPADGILSPNDDIGIKFNETVDLGALTSLNFDVRGVLNGTETKHSTSLFFDGVDDYLDVSGGVALKNRSFTLQLAVKRAGTGEETLLSQGIDENENLFLGFNASNQLVFRINDQEVVSTTTFDNELWHYIGLSYDFENETADMYLANEVESGTINVGNNTLFPNYEGSGRLLMGKQGFGAANSFHGNIHEVRVWDRALTFNEFSVTMNRILSGSEAGLLYNWRMDEAEDIFAIDHVRRRDAAIFGATWAVEPGGSAASFDGTSYLSVGSGDVLITPEMNFTLEFWFRGSGTNPETLFSNGSGGNTLADSLYSWVIEKDANGLLHARNNGIDFLMSDVNYFDGQWHHVALVMNRNANLSAIVDGNPQLSALASPFQQFGGATVSLGAYVYQDGGLVEANEFTGELDEFRLWNTNRKVAQIDRDKRNRMLGDEPSLKLYLPFENYVLDPTGIPILTPSFDEQIDAATHVVVNNGAVLQDETPTIKLQRPIEAVAFTYAVNNDEIIITVTSDPAMVENVTLDITVLGVKDLQGNVMASPVTWIAYMDKNQVVWGDDLLVFEKPVGDELSFNSQIVNQGGASKAFTVENIPAWMNVNPSSGTVPPNSAIPVSFEVDPLMNIGDYVQDLQLLTDFGFAEKLTIDLKVRETPPNWVVDPSDFQYSMGIIGLLEIKGIVSSDAEDILSAFVGEEVRGVGQVTYLEDLDRYLVFLDVYSNSAGSEQITFKIWDAGSGVVYSQVTPQFITFSSNGLVGSALDPQVFSTDFEIEDRRVLEEGWNWIGYYLQNEDSAQFDVLLSSLMSQNGDQVNGQETFANYSGSHGWTGPLSAAGLRPEDGYKFYVNAADTLVMRGDVIDPTSRTISMLEGWNWIGFVSIRNQGIAQALGNLNPMEGDQIKGRSAFAVYVNDALGWQGTLETLLPGEGYMYQSGQDVDFTFPFAGQFKRNDNSRNKIARHSMWNVDYGAYANNMNMILTLDEGCGTEENWNELLLGAFDEMGTIRGLAEVTVVEERPVMYMTVNAAAGSNLNLKWIDIESGMVYPESVSHGFEANGLSGSFEAPLVINLPPGLCDQVNGNAGSDGVYVYPTLFDETLNIAVDAAREGKVRLTLFDMSGRPLLEEVSILVEGQNQLLFDVSRIHLAAGTYTLVIETDAQKVARKVIKTN